MSEKNNKQDSSNERSIFSSLPEKFNILDEEVDVAVQFEYIRQAKKYKKSLKVNTAGSDISEAVLIENYRQELFSEATEPERLKRILIELANNESPAAFRLIESFLEVTPSNLRSWTLMAFQECKMGIESQLLGERPVYVSTGLGGKDNKLRYSIAFRQTEGIAFEDYQQKLLQSEVVFSVGSVEGVVEESVFDTEFAVFKVLIPSSVPLKEVFDEVISNCNTIVEFVSESVIITNYKNLLPAELRRKREAGEGDSDGLPFELDFRQ
jgi:hypothetical protein